MESNQTTTTTTNDNNNSNNPFLRVVLHPDGSISRPPVPLAPPSSSTADNKSWVFSEDVTRISAHGTDHHQHHLLRLYYPKIHLNEHQKLPVIVFFHGGGFILFSYDFLLYHSFCEKLAANIPAIVVSVDYRLAPESRLPAAYDDAVEVLHWLRHQAEERTLVRTRANADFSRCFLMGSSSGANIVYHAGLRCAAENLLPVRIAGMVMYQPFLGGVARTRPELELEDDPILPLRVTDMMWSLSLPEGADRDHEYCNPMKTAAKTAKQGQEKCKLPRCLVMGNAGDPLVDRQREFVMMLEAAGVNVVATFDKVGHHAAEIMDADMAAEVIGDIRCFINETSAKHTTITSHNHTTVSSAPAVISDDGR